MRPWGGKTNLKWSREFAQQVFKRLGSKESNLGLQLRKGSWASAERISTRRQTGMTLGEDGMGPHPPEGPGRTQAGL